MKITWKNIFTEEITIKKFLQRRGLGHRLISAVKHGEGLFWVNNRIVDAGSKLKPQQAVTLELKAEGADPAVQTSHAPLNVIFEDDAWMVINKEPGVSSIPGPTNTIDTVLNRVKGHLVDEQAEDLKPHLITRLDRDTSGLMLIAKNRVAHSLVSSQVEAHQMDKRYLAIVNGPMTIEHGLIDAALGRDENSPRRVIDPNGKNAQTEYWLKQTGSDLAVAEVNLHTGRTHQIRAHFANYVAPLLGDELYGGSSKLISRQALHAEYLSFYDPITEQKREFRADPPEDMIDVINRI